MSWAPKGIGAFRGVQAPKGVVVSRCRMALGFLEGPRTGTSIADLVWRKAHNISARAHCGAGVKVWGAGVGWGWGSPSPTWHS